MTVSDLVVELMKLVPVSKRQKPSIIDEVEAIAKLLYDDFLRSLSEIGEGNVYRWVEHRTTIEKGKAVTKEIPHERIFNVEVSASILLDGNPNDTLAIQCALDKVLIICFDMSLRLKLVERLFGIVDRRLRCIKIKRSSEGKVLIGTVP